MLQTWGAVKLILGTSVLICLESAVGLQEKMSNGPLSTRRRKRLKAI